MVDHVKICLTSSLITMQNLVVVSDTVFALPKLGGHWGPNHCGRVRV